MLLTEYNETRAMEMFKEEGRQEGETRLGALIAKLISAGRTNDVAKAVSDPTCRTRLYREFRLA